MNRERERERLNWIFWGDLRMGWPILLESAKKEWEKIWAALMLMLNWGKDDTTPWKKRREWGGGEVLLLKVEWIVLNWKRLALSIFLILSSLFYSLSLSANRKLTLSLFSLSVGWANELCSLFFLCFSFVCVIAYSGTLFIHSNDGLGYIRSTLYYRVRLMLFWGHLLILFFIFYVFSFVCIYWLFENLFHPFKWRVGLSDPIQPTYI